MKEMTASLRLNMDGFNRWARAIDKDMQFASVEAMEFSVEELTRMTLAQVPRDTNALADSFDARLELHNGRVVARMGYGLKNNVARKAGAKAPSEYMTEVHEDLEVPHAVGKAKYFEDPLRDFSTRFEPGVAKVIQSRMGRWSKR